MKLFLDYLNKIKFHILLMIFPTIFTGIIFFLYQLSPEPVLYVALLWLLAGLTACMTGFSNYRKKLQQLTLIATAPDINLSRMDTPSDQIESLQQDIMHRLNQIRNRRPEISGRNDRLLYHVGTSDQNSYLCPASAPSGKSLRK